MMINFADHNRFWEDPAYFHDIFGVLVTPRPWRRRLHREFSHLSQAIPQNHPNTQVWGNWHNTVLGFWHQRRLSLPVGLFDSDSDSSDSEADIHDFMLNGGLES